MNKMLMVTNGGQIASQSAKIGVALLALLAMFGGLLLPVAHAQMTPAQMIEAELPQGTTIQTAAKAEFLTAVCNAVSKNRAAAPQIVRFAAEIKPDWKEDILRSAFRCLGTDDCRLLTRVLRALATGDDAATLTALAVELAPDCAGAFGTGGVPGPDEGGFGQAPGNLNPPPGSIGGGGGQGNVVAVCVNNVTRFVSPEAAEQILRTTPGARLGACTVTPNTNR